MAAEIERLQFVESLTMFGRVMSKWAGWSGPSFNNNEYQKAKTEDIDELELFLFAFYSQTFFDTFGRAPTVPRRIDLIDSLYVKGWRSPRT